MPYKHASYKTRCQVQALRFSAGWTYRRIAEDQNLAVSTVHDICHGPSTPRKTKGRPILLDTPTRCRLVAMATQSAEHRRMPLREVAALCDIEACDRTLRKAFAKEGYARRVARRKPLLDARQRQLRLDFALAHHEWTIEDWRRVIWTDECYIWLSGTLNRTWVTRRPSEVYHDDCLVPKFPQKNSIMIWGGILGSKKTPLVLWDRNNWGTITSQSYVDHVLIPALQPFWQHESGGSFGEDLWIMEDGAPAHRARYTQSVQQNWGMRKLNWPPCSPNLNPIENVWRILKDALNKRTPHPAGMPGMKAAIEEEWQRISEDIILSFIDSMPRRIEAVIAAAGGHTKW